MLVAPECPKMRIFLVNLDAKKQVKVHYVKEIAHKVHPWCLGCVPIPTLDKMNRCINEYGPKIPDSTKIAVFIFVSE